jgi:hypothetical protein
MVIRFEFNIDEIIPANLAAFSKEYVYQFIQKFENEYGYIRLLDSGKIRLAEVGRNFFQIKVIIHWLVKQAGKLLLLSSPISLPILKPV